MSRAEVINGAEIVSGGVVMKQQGAHFEPHTVVVPTGVKPSCPGTLRDGSVEHVGRVSGVRPVEDPFVGYRFREKLHAASAAAATGIVLGPRRYLRSDLLDIHNRVEAVIGVKEGRQLFPCSRRVAPPDPSPGYPGKSARI
jgi:hypothetical protein